MPKISLRLSDEQHHLIVTQAKRNHRSLNNEILHRLFPPGQTGASPPDDWERHFKPDPKPEKKK